MSAVRCLLLVALCLLCVVRPAPAEEPLRRIAFGSGASQEKSQPIWDAILATRPEFFLFLGNIIYGDTDNAEVMQAKYAQLAAIPGYQRLLQGCPVYGVWD